jgi:hypothetical protein
VVQFLVSEWKKKKKKDKFLVNFFNILLKETENAEKDEAWKN